MNNLTIVVSEKTTDFALDVIDVYKRLPRENQNIILSKKLLESGTSIGAQVKGLETVSRELYISGIYKALKSAEMCKYWLFLLKESDYIAINDWHRLDDKNREVLNLLNEIVKQPTSV